MIRVAIRLSAAILLVLASGLAADAQITPTRTLSASTDRFATLEEQLVNRLRATREEQREYLQLVVKQVKAGKLDAKLVVAIERYAIRRYPTYPFPFFERALMFEARRRGVTLPTSMAYAATSDTRNR